MDSCSSCCRAAVWNGPLKIGPLAASMVTQFQVVGLNIMLAAIKISLLISYPHLMSDKQTMDGYSTLGQLFSDELSNETN